MTERISRTRVFPEPSADKVPKAVPLSILDSTAGRFCPTGAIWVFDGPPRSEEATHRLVEKLEASFVGAVNSFPHWAGELFLVQPDSLDHDAPPHSRRFGRVWVRFGSPQDPGVELTVVQFKCLRAQDLAPTPEERATQKRWDCESFQQKRFVSDTPLALKSLQESKGQPAMTVQISLLAGGGYVIGVKISHLLADAHSMMVFVNKWSAMANGKPGLEPYFDPALLDAAAAGDIDGPSPDPTELAKARSLPMHRFDWWLTSAPGYPEAAKKVSEATKPPPGSTITFSPSFEVPWSELNIAAPVSYTLFHLTATELSTMRDRTRVNGAEPISRLDCLLARLWAAINRARGLSKSDETVFLDTTMGVRARVSPPLPDTFIGSPLIMAHVALAGAATQSPERVAQAVRRTTQLFTPRAIGAVLHDAAFEASPHRLWTAMIGRRHTLLTSWLRLRIYDVAFGSDGHRPRYVHPLMPEVDGIVQVVDAGTGEGHVDVAVYLDEPTMRRLRMDENLWAD